MHKTRYVICNKSPCGKSTCSHKSTFSDGKTCVTVPLGYTSPRWSIWKKKLSCNAIDRLRFRLGRLQAHSTIDNRICDKYLRKSDKFEKCTSINCRALVCRCRIHSALDDRKRVYVDKKIILGDEVPTSVLFICSNTKNFNQEWQHSRFSDN